jgi:hypothetical protein
MQGFTTKMEFESNRPPGTRANDYVISVSQMDVKQSWSPDDGSAMTPGDVISRRITRTANGTTAMMLSPLSFDSIPSVRIYPSPPQVSDNTQRGEFTATRIDVVQYQFERPGEYSIPETDVVWWDPKSEALQRKTLGGIAITVEGDVILEETPDVQNDRHSWILGIGVTILGVGLGIVAVWIIQRRLTAPRNPETVAARRFIAACQSQDAATAYAALLQWERLVGNEWNGSTADGSFASFRNRLVKHLYGSAPQDWNWQDMMKSFQSLRSNLKNRPVRPNRGIQSMVHCPAESARKIAGQS